MAPTAPMIGRERELAQCAAVVQRRAPALILVSSDAGVGKSRFLQGLAAQTEAGGWTVLPGTAAAELSIGSAANPGDFTARVRQLLGLPESGDHPVHAHATLQTATPGLVRQLAARAPLMLLIDGYRPSARFADWFERQLIPDIRATGAPVVIVVAEVPDTLAACARHTDPQLLLRLAPLRASAVRAHLAQACGGADPPLTNAELERYSRAVSRDPELLQALVSVLCLAGAEVRATAPGAAHA